ncbi:MAG: tetratricopeptide repeat protein [Cyanobacteria bacterium P01_A01_bin.84]
MLRRLFQWLQKSLKRLFGSKHISSRYINEKTQAVKTLPELTNADLEFLFTQLLEGVYQGRGQGWALRYIQRMENRISHERWLGWLRGFGEKLLSSVAPNHELAYRMVQLGELEIGEIGDLTYDIGMQLLTRNINDLYEDDIQQEDTRLLSDSLLQEEVSSYTQKEVSLPKPQLPNLVSRGFNETQTELDLWKQLEENLLSTTNETDAIGSLEEVLLWQQPENESGSEMTEADAIAALGEIAISGENQQDLRDATNQESTSTFGVSQFFHQEELDREYEENEEYINLQENIAFVPPEVTNFPVSHGSSTEETDIKENDLTETEIVYSSQIEGIEEIEEIEAIPTSKVYNHDENLAQPEVALTLDELSVRLQQSANLVEQLAYGLAKPSLQPLQNQFIDSAPDTVSQAESWFYKGLQQAKTGDLMTALASYDQAISFRPEVYEYWFNRGLALFHLGDFTAALASYDQALAIKPDAYKGWYNRGGTLGELGRFNEAIASFEQAIELNPGYYEAWSSRGLALVEVGLFDDAVYSYNQAVNLQPQDQDNWYYRGMALLAKGEYWEAIASFEQAVEIDPLLANGWFNRGVAFSELERWEDVISSLDKVLALEPGSEESWYLRGNAFDKLNQLTAALASYEQALNIKSDLHEAWIDKGVVLFKLGRQAEAIAAWDNAIKIQPDFYLAWFNRAIALEQIGREDEAIASYDQAIEIYPDFYLVWYNRAVLSFKLERYEEAIAYYDRTLELQADYWQAWLGRGRAAGASLGYDRRFELFSNIPASNEALNERGYTGRLVSYEVGLNYLSQDTHPEGWGRLHLALGNAHYEQGRKHPTPHYYWQQAVDEYNKSLLSLNLDTYAELHLEVLQNQIRTLIALGQREQAQQLQKRASDIWRDLLNQPHLSEADRKQLSLKLVGIWQFAVDLSIQFGEFLYALEIAEYNKNACLTWQLMDWTNNIPSPSYQEMQQLLDAKTAMIYWHISPCALHTFIIKHNPPEPILVFTPVTDDIGEIHEFPQREAMVRLIEFEDWQKDWYEKYQDYRIQAAELSDPQQHPWYADMEYQLSRLRSILNISLIEEELQDIEQLILVPHCDLHKFPLHALFNLVDGSSTDAEHRDIFISQNSSRFAISYLPSAYTGLTLHPSKNFNLRQQIRQQNLLSVENPESREYVPLKFAKIESEVISEMFHNPTRIEGLEATKVELENAFSTNKHNIFHLSGYSQDNLNEPYKSELILANSDTLTLKDISKYPLENYSLFTVSAKEYSFNENQNIQSEYVGLVSGLLIKGVNQIVSTKWTVDSVATTLVMIEFYRKLQSESSAIAALSETIKWLQELNALELKQWYEELLNQLPPEAMRIKAHLATLLYKIGKEEPYKQLYNHPYYWAAFTISGRFN